VAKNLQTVARRALTPCAAVDAFRFADGAMARDLADLRHIVASKSAFLVWHHRDQYHAWVERVLGDPALGRRIERLASARRGPSSHAPASDLEAFRSDLLVALDERLAKLRDRVV